MKLAGKLTIALGIGIFAVMVGYAYFQVRQEVRLSQSDLERARRFGLAWLGTIEAVWEREGPARVQELVQRANQRSRGITLEVYPFDFAAGQLAEVRLSPEQRRVLAAGEVIRALEHDQEGHSWGHGYVAFGPRGSPSAVVELTEPEDKEIRFIQMTHWGIALATLTVVLVCGLIVMGLQYWLVGQPIEALREKARRAGAGDFSAPLLVAQNDEIGELARDINAMCDRIADANRKLAEETEARVAALEQLRHTDRLATVGQLAAGVAHDLGTPLSVVSARAQLLAATAGSGADIQGNARAIVEQCDRMTEIIQRLLDFSRRRGAALGLADLRHVVRRTLEMLSPVARKARVELALEAPEDPVLVRIDQNHMQQALVNVVRNGIQAMPRGGHLRLQISVRRGRPPATAVGGDALCACVEVEDEGTGIPAEDLPRIFEPFFTTKDEHEGTGLGLPVAQGIVVEHGGWITVDSRVGGGSRFSIFLPSSDDHTSAARGAAA